MPARASRDLEALLDAVSHARSLPAAEAEPRLRQFLAHKNALVVSRAARHAASLDLRSLAPELAAAFARFMPPHDAATLDPQCWAKHEIVKALAAFEYLPAEVFLAALHYRQSEPSWGGPVDTAGPTRGHAALALVQCRDIPSDTLLRELLPLFADKELPVRVNVARAVEQLGTQSSALLLRLRAELGSDEPESLAACIGGVLRLEGEPALPWVATFLQQPDGLAAEVAFLLAAYRRPAALLHLQQAFDTARDHNLRDTLLQAIASTRLPDAWTWLLERIDRDRLHAGFAREALLAANPPEDVRARLTGDGPD